MNNDAEERRPPVQLTGGRPLVRVARAAAVAALIGAVVVADSFLFPFVVPRAVWFRFFVALAAAAVGILLLRTRARLVPGRDLVFLGLLAYLVISVIAAAVGVAPIRSFFGDLERMGGVWTLLHLFLLYVLLRSFFDVRDWDRLLGLLSLLGGIVALSAAAEYLGMGFTSSGRVRRPDGLLGSPGYIGGLMLLVVPVAALAVSRSRGLLRAIHTVIILLALAALVLSLTRAAVLGAIVGSVVAVSGWAWRGGHRKTAVAVVIAVTGLVPVLFFVARFAEPETGLRRIAVVQRAVGTERAQTDGLSFRLTAWRTAAEAGADRWLLGWGPENETQALSSRLRPSHYETMPGGLRLDRSHNVLLDVWVTTGILGLLAYGLMWLGLLSNVKRAWDVPGSSPGWALVLGGVAAYLIYLLFWIPDLVGWIYLIAIAALAATVASGRKALELLPREEPAAAWLAPLLVVVVLGLLYAQSFHPLLQARRVLEADAGSPKSGEQRLVLFEEAVTAGATQKLQAILRHERFLQRSFFDPEVRTNLTALVRILESADVAAWAARREIERDPRNDALYGGLASLNMIDYEAKGDTLALANAVEKIEQARHLAPGKIRYDHVLSQVLLTAGDTAAARRVLEATLQRYAGFGETYAMLARTALATDDPRRAGLWIRRGAAIEGWRFRDPSIPIAVADELEDSLPGEAAVVLEAYMAAHYDAFPDDTATVNPYTWRITTRDLPVLNRLPVLWAASGEVGRARLTSAILAAQVSEAGDAARAFARSLDSDTALVLSARQSVIDPARLDSIIGRRQAGSGG